MKQFWAFVGKEFKHIFRDTKTMLLLIAMPIIQIVLFGFAISAEVKDARIAFFSPQYDEQTNSLVEKFNASKTFNVHYVLTDPSGIDELFRKNKVEMVIVLPQSFSNDIEEGSKSSVQLLLDGSDPNTAGMISAYTENMLREWQMDRAAKTGRVGMPKYTIVPSVRMLYNPQSKSSFNFVPGVMGLIFMLICAMMTSVSIVREKERGTMEVLLVSPVRTINIVLSKAVPYLLLSLFNFAVILLLAHFVLGVPMAGSLVMLTLLSFIFIMTALSFGLLISTIVKTQMMAVMISGIVLMAPTIVLSGMIVPLETMPRLLKWCSDILPATWYISGVKKIMIQGTPAIYAAKEFIVLSGMCVALLGTSLLNFKDRL